MSDIIYTPPASGGGGLNPTPSVIPYNNGSSNFSDSNIATDVNNYIGTYTNHGIGDTFGWLVDFSNSLIQLGDISGIYQTTLLTIDSNLSQIVTYNYGFRGINLDFSVELYSFGDFNSISSGTSFYIDELNSTMYTKHSGQQEGLFFDFVNDYFQIGDFGSTNNGTYLTIDDDNQFIASYTNGNLKGLSLDFLNEQYSLGDYNAISYGNYITINNTGDNEVVICANKQLNIKGSSIQDSNFRTYALQNLKIQAPDGHIYYIPLYI